ncbi:uncharacterized protein LOC132720726 [Ruditapes philippinarum]|uniref:uncharacterized protein LOC132720726 n=1 Tax=Ruditapes philippinarum TaxID=129788 RepID=UPI00295B7E41|nr:uncharacterized protein LOC132720726 [Ruditapes philippinarum]
MAAKLIKEHNTNVLQSLEKGDMVEIKRSFSYSHWAVYVGDEKVINLTGDDNNWSSAFNTVVKLEDFWKVVDGCKCYQRYSKNKKMRFHLIEKVCLTKAAISIEEHNTRVLQSLGEGDLVEIDRGFYSHWAVYAGGEMVIHLTSDYNNESSAFSNYGSVLTTCGDPFDKAYVKLEEFSKVVKGDKSFKNNSKDTKMR